MFKETRWDRFLDKIGYWPVYRFVTEVRRRIRWTPYFIGKVWDYTKLLWNDWDFDYLSLLRLIELKTKRTREYLIEENLVKTNERLMREVEALCKRIYADDYFSEEWDELHKEHPHAWRRIFHEDTGCYHSTMNDENYGRRVSKLHKKQEAQLEEDLDRLFHIIRRHIRVWWS